MIAEFTFDEMVYNTVCSGRIIYYQNVKKTINYIKMDKGTRQLVIHCLDGDVFVAKQDEIHSFEVNGNKEWRKPNKKRLTGKK